MIGFQKGDRVASFHSPGTPAGTYAEYSLLPAHTTFHIPSHISFEEAATIPLIAGTAAAGLFERDGGLGLPLPIQRATKSLALTIYGASGSVGTFAVQLARQANIHPLICIAGNGATKVEPLLDRSKGDTIIDYRKGKDEVVKAIREALEGLPLMHALDTVAGHGSSYTIAEAMSSGGKIARTLPPEGELSNGVEQFQLSVSSVHGDEKDFGFAMYQLFGRGLQHGWIEPRPYEVVRGGLDGVERALVNLKAGKASAIKYILRIDETDGLEGMS